MPTFPFLLYKIYYVHSRKGPCDFLLLFFFNFQTLFDRREMADYNFLAELLNYDRDCSICLSKIPFRVSSLKTRNRDELYASIRTTLRPTLAHRQVDYVLLAINIVLYLNIIVIVSLFFVFYFIPFIQWYFI